MFETISNRKIKFALVGCGRISNNHFGSFESLQDEIPPRLKRRSNAPVQKVMAATRKCWPKPMPT